jgi:tetrahydromethanopterin S-methyltransferase subunit G
MASRDLNQIDDRVQEVEGKLMTHEAVCAERYSGINARLKRLEGILIASGGAIILLLLSLVLKMK